MEQSCVWRRVASQRASGLRERVDAYVAPLVQQRAFSGTILLAKEGRVLLARRYGFPTATSRLVTDSTTLYEIGSITKTMTAAAIELLAQQGKLAPGYAGRYQIAPGFVLTVRAGKEGLLLAGPDGVFVPLDTDSRERFFFRLL